jgi:hypoxanthine phosphoribosyltransferase
LKIAFSEEQIQTRVRAMAEEISRQYDGEVVHAVGILENGVMFLADLVRRLSCPVVCHFLKMETVEDSVEAGHQPRRSILYGPVGNIGGQNILLVDMLVDSGITLDHLVQQMLLIHKPKSLRTAAMVDREDRRRVPFRLDYTGFPWVGTNLLVGYGLAKDGLYRNLPYVAELPS